MKGRQGSPAPWALTLIGLSLAQVLDFVRSACAGPHEGVGARTTLFGVQATPYTITA